MPGAGLDRLEYPRLRQLLELLAASHAGRSAFRELIPYPTRDEAENVLLLVSGLKRMQEHGRGLPPLEVDDLQPVLGLLKTRGTVLSPEEILSLIPLLVLSRVAKEVLETAEDPGIKFLAAPLRAMPHLERAIDEVFERDGQIKDRASSRLRSIRREREQRREKLRSRLERMASGLGGSESASLVTLREGRYVLSVPQDQKSKVKGLVQDRSASGATFYMEPLDLVEDNNALRELDAEERTEIRRILAELTDRLRGEQESLRTNYQEVGYLDTLRARVRLALRWRSEPPKFSENQAIRLRGARHPLLLEARGVSDDVEGAHRSVVPLDLDLDEEMRILLITGPNMGGKTVALKTLGLLSAMAQSGCLIPAVPGCELPWVNRWLVSLGDEQSLEQDLSTFAAHLKQWGEALAEAGPGSLVLMDELGSGTDPSEGAALAQSVLERLVEAGSLGLVTTHLGSLKAFAASEVGIRNASMVFDPESQQPTFGLAVGIPGESHAIEMARHLGFPEERVKRAEELLPQEERDVKELLAELNSERRRLAAGNEELKRKVEEASRIEEERRERLQHLLEERASIRAKAARQAREIVRRAEETLREAKKSSKGGSRPESLSRGNLAREQARLARLEAPKREEVMGPRPERVDVGEWYWAQTLAREVQVVQEPDGSGRVMVVREGMRVELPVESLRVITGKVRGNGDRDSRPKPHLTVPEVENPPVEIHLRGLRVDECLEQLDRALDQAILAGLKEIRVIHGKGTGTLRRVVEEFCRNRPGVKSSRTGEQWEGGAGATVIELEG